MSMDAAVRRIVFPLVAAMALAFGGAGSANAAFVVGGTVPPSPAGVLNFCAGDCLFENGAFVISASGAGFLSGPHMVPVGKDGGFAQSFAFDGTEAITVTMEALNVAGNIDPVQMVVVSVVDHGLPTNVAVQVIMPMTGIAGAAAVSSSLTGSCSDAGTDGCGSTPIGGTFPPTIGEYLVGAAIPGPPLTSVGIGVGAGSSNPPPPPFGPFTANGPFDCAAVGGCNVFGTIVSFTGSGNDDTITWSSEFEILSATAGGAIPEPGTLGLFGVGLVGLGTLRRRRRDG